MTTARPPAWWPLPDGPYALIDAYQDGKVEEHCWVPVRVVDGPRYNMARATGGREAAAVAYARDSLGEALHLEPGTALALLDGVSWHRPRVLPDEHGEYVERTDDPCDDCEDGGCSYWARENVDPIYGAGYHGPRPPCDSCHGTRKMHIDYDEGVPWTTCQPDEPGATAFYALEVQGT